MGGKLTGRHWFAIMSERMDTLKQHYKIFLTVLVAALLFGAFAFGVYVGRDSREGSLISAFAQEPVLPPQGVDFSPVWKVWNILNEKYVSASSTETSIGAEARVWGMIQGLTDSLGDPYTVFLPPAEAEIFEADISGNFEGVGMEIATKDNVLTVVAPLKDTPAYKAGIQSGDKIIEIDGKKTESLSVDQAVTLIRGERGSEVIFTIVREGRTEPFTISVIRDVIQIPAISTSRDDGAGLREDGVFVIQLYNFSAISQELFREALREFVLSHSDKLVLDLRGNPGGYLEAAVDMASWFLPVGKVVVEENFGPNGKPKVHRSRGYDVFNENLKMAILINQGSASASEILAAALQEHGVATLIGERTFGKGSVQELVNITDTTSLKVTIARWLTPNGHSISDSGLEPDVVVELSAEDREKRMDPQLERAAEFLVSL